MNLIVLTTLGIFALPMIGMTQITDRSTACPVKEPVADDVVLTVCNHESGMVPLPQPRLYLRLYADGRGEIEIGAPPPRTGPYMKQTLLKKVFHVDADEVAEIRRLGRMADFQSAKDVYPPYAIATDTALSTTVMFNDRGASKKIIVNNFSYSIAYDTKHYGLSFCSLMARVEELRDRGLGIVREPPSISFCELIRHRESYIGWVVAISVFLEYTETQQFIKDPDCAKPSMGSLFTKEKLGVGFDVKGGDAKVIHALKDKAISIRDPRFGGRAQVYIYGILRDNRARTSGMYDYRFDIREFKTIDPIVLPYKGRLEPGWMYVDSFDSTNENRLKLSEPLKMSLHHAARIEWLNTGKFPKLRAAGRTFITFRVVSREIKKIGDNRWNDTYTCEILDL